jgi:LDH2 family malate/lactate/ureidoglycolate dehydrogenase
MTENWYSLDELRGFATTVFERHGLPAADAAIVVERMLDADVRGIRAHGLFRLVPYCRRIEAGGYNLHPDIRIVRETSVTALVDGDNGFGQLVLTRAAEIAIERASEHGLAWVGTRGSNHGGAAGVYASMALEHDMVGICLAVGNANQSPPWGGVDLLLSTNPIAVAIPAGEQPPVVLDMATTVASLGSVKAAAARGESMPEGWMVDRTGAPLTDPNRASEGFLLPIGGYKGYGLGLVVGLLAGVVNGAAMGSQVINMSTELSTPTNSGQLIIALRPDVFQPKEEFLAAMDDRIRELRESTPMDGHPPVRTPGDQMPQRLARADEEGLELPPGTVAEFVAHAEEIGVSAEVFDR